jgi:hypothetical protein
MPRITPHASRITSRNDLCASISAFIAVAAASAGVAEGRRGQPPAFLYSAVRLVEGLTRARRSRAGAFLAALRWLVLALFIVALAQPRLMKSATTVKASGIDIVCALDLSGSMISEDFVVRGQRVNRVNMAKSVLKDFIDKRPNDRIGLVVFAAQAFIAAPLTLDHDYLQENLDRLEIGTINSDATAIGDALTTAINRLRDLKSKSKIVILATDGQNNSGKIQPLLAADAAAALGVKIIHDRHWRAGHGADAGVHERAKGRLSTGAGGRGRGHAPKNRRQDRREILSRRQRGTVPANLRGD